MPPCRNAERNAPPPKTPKGPQNQPVARTQEANSDLLKVRTTDPNKDPKPNRANNAPNKTPTGRNKDRRKDHNRGKDNGAPNNGLRRVDNDPADPTKKAKVAGRNKAPISANRKNNALP